MNELIKLNTIKGQNEPFISSVLIAELFEKRHTDVLRDICNKYNGGQRTFASSVLVSGKVVIIEGTYKNKQNKEQKMYYLNERAFQKLALGFTGERAEQYQDMILDEFDKMKQMIVDLQLGKPEAIISLLTWKNDNMETTIRTYINGGNVLNVMPAIIEKCKQKVENGEMKIRIIATIIRTLEDMRDNETIIGNRDNYASAILDINHKLRHIQNTRLGGVTKANNDLRAKLGEKEKEVKQAETKRLCTYSKRALKEAYEESGIINDLVRDIVNDVLVDDEKETFKANLKANVKLIVDNSHLNWEEAYTAVYNAMGLFKKPDTYKTMVDYVWENHLENKCLDAAVRVRARYGC